MVPPAPGLECRCMAWHRIDMSWHGMVVIDAHRARRGAARRHPTAFRSKDYAPAGEIILKFPNPPTRESADVVRMPQPIHSELRRPILELMGSKTFPSVLDS